ncbi:FecCD family ABC transporter permease [Faecalicatena contorta]|uniref:ABC-type Fe3+-siderophore transport system, permease component n=1 Tax=Faecalicatena contorta TaxID=39482 RepID=A0A315ZQ28_9FIRM|nr:iron ABC transporter permease [Faecalicatena contorta]PWJ47008.1 ABC-type Fe3+-siderophore transport system permease subunit [Faecalicatena contorta]SUQ16220.1 ABC-type Fe3+-siderophore transport system, permease component [Faecalicatena contorta]
MKKQRYTMNRGIWMILIMTALMLAIAVISMNSGKMNLTPGEVLNVILGKGTEKQNLIVFEFRLPRIILAVLVGIGMGASGCIMQSLLRNDMASPGTLGISSGSGLFVLMFIVFFRVEGMSSIIALPLLAFIGGITAAAIIYLLSYRRGKDISPTGLILTGVALGSGYGALTTLLTLKLDQNQMDFIQRWSAGSLWGDNWNYIAVLAPWILILFVYTFYKSRILNALNLGNQTATGLGVAVKPEFLGLSIAAVALSSGSVAVGGNFFFVGMIAPHMARKLVGPNHRLLMPASCLTASIVILLADTITRTVSLGSDVPTGIIITVLSTPYFLYLLARSN